MPISVFCTANPPFFWKSGNIAIILEGSVTNMAKVYKLTAARLKELQDEMVWMKTVREKEVADLIKEARSFGDLSENSEYDEAKNEQGKLYSRMAEVEDILANYELINEDEFDAATIHPGCVVKVSSVEMNCELEYKIVGSQEADPMNGRISEESPFGRALMGKRVGDEIVVEAPAGLMHYTVLSIA